MKTTALSQCRIELRFVALKSVALPTEPNLMTVLAYTIDFSALMWMNTGTFRLTKIYSEAPEDSAFILSKSRFNHC